MNAKLVNKQYRADGIFGLMSMDDGTEFDTLQHAYPDGSGYVPKLAQGTYTCVRRMSPHFGYEVFMVESVPDFQGKPVSYIEIHRGNYNADSDGCILLGLSIRPIDSITQMLASSAPAFNLFMGLQNGVNEFTLTVEDV
jgi:hypothetical protein